MFSAYILKVGLAGCFPNYVQVLLKSLVKKWKHCIFSLKIPFRHKILRILIIYALLTQNFCVKIHALFPQICLGWRAKSADLFTFRMYEVDWSVGQSVGQTFRFVWVSEPPRSVHRDLWPFRHLIRVMRRKNWSGYDSNCLCSILKRRIQMRKSQGIVYWWSGGH